MSVPATTDHAAEKPDFSHVKTNGSNTLKKELNGSNDLEASTTHATYLPSHSGTSLPPGHQEYLLERHGTIELDPLPGFGDADPLNWKRWKKTTNLILVAFHAMMSTFTAAAIIPAYQDIAADLGVSLQQASYLTSLQIAILGVAPLLWKPFSTRYGRRPTFLLSLLFSFAGNLGCARSPTYGTMALCRAIVAFFISPAMAVGSGVVAESFFKKERAKYMGVWTIMITLGVPIAPFIFGFVAFHTGYRWIYWILAIINAVQFVLYLLLGPETRYIRSGVAHEGSDSKQEYLTLRRIDPTPFSIRDFLHPFVFFARPNIFIAAAAYAMVFCIAGVLVTVELPQLFGEKFAFNPQQLGLQFLAIIIGSIIGEQVGGILSDKWMSRRVKKTGRSVHPEYRLWLCHPGTILAIVGTAVFLVQTDRAEEKRWNITPDVGIAICSTGLQLVTTVLVTYSVDCHPTEAASIGVFITFVRQIWSFIGPFWFPPMFEIVGVAASGGVVAALLIAVSLIPTILLQWKGNLWRKLD